MVVDKKEKVDTLDIIYLVGYYVCKFSLAQKREMRHFLNPD